MTRGKSSVWSKLNSSSLIRATEREEILATSGLFPNRLFSLGEERQNAQPRVGCGVRAIITFMFRVLKCVAGAGVDLYIHGFIEALHGLFEGLDFGGRDSTIKRAKIPQNRSLDFFNIDSARWQRTVIHNASS